MKSKKALFAFFKEKYGRDLNLQNAGIGDETYGKKSYVYVYDTVDLFGKTRAPVIKDLVAAGFPRPDDWGKSTFYGEPKNGLEIRVSYFKGKNWDE